MNGSVDQPPIRIETSVRKVRGTIWAAAALCAAALVPLLTMGVYLALPRISGLGGGGLVAIMGGFSLLVVTTVHRYAYAGRESKVIIMDPSGVTVMQGDRRRVWPWSEVMEPKLLPNGAGVFFGKPLTLSGEKRVFGDTFDVPPKELFALLIEARDRWGGAPTSR